MNTYNKPFFYSEPLKLWDKWSIGSYALITLILGVMYSLQDESSKLNILLIYTISSQLFIIMFLYTSLRNFKAFLFWCLFGLIHFIVYFLIKDDIALQIGKSRPAGCLKITIPLLLLFQLFRYISITLRGRDFVMPAKGKDLFEGKKVSALDYIIAMSYTMLWAASLIIYLKKI